MAEDTQFQALMKKILESPPEVVEQEVTPVVEEDALGLSSLLGGAKEKAGDLFEWYKRFSYPEFPDQKEVPSDIKRPPEKPIPSPVFWRQSSVIQSIIENDPIIGKIIQAESSGDPTIESPKGAIGLMQIMPATARGGVDKAGNKTYAHGMHGITLTIDELYDPEKNVKFGSQYFNELRKSFGNDYHALVAYNDGPGDAKKWIKDGAKFEDLNDETRDYVTKIIGVQKNIGGMISRNPYPHNPRPI